MKNKIELIGLYGNDESHANSAWTSTSRELTEEKKKRIPALLKMLVTGSDGNSHGTPFEKSSLHFLVTADIASHIHCLKHRIGVSINCIDGETLIAIPRPSMDNKNNGIKLRSIKQLYEEYNNGIISYSKNKKKYKRKYGRKVPVRTKNIDSNLIAKSTINKVFFNGVQPTYKFITNSGKYIICTLAHQFYTPEGFKEIGQYLDIKFNNNIATLGNKNKEVATNGIEINDLSRPWTNKEFFDEYKNFTRKEVAKLTGLTYELIKKWGYIHNIEFKKDLNKDFKKNQIPWNYKRYGYKAPRTKKGINPNINKNLSYKNWRATVGNWTRQQLPKLLKDYKYTCQAQLTACSIDFICHHIIPVEVDDTLATDYNNLSLVCRNCHKAIHKSKQSETDFAIGISEQEIKDVFKTKRTRKGRKLAFNFEKIVSVEYMGEREVYDLEIDNTHNYVANGFLVHNCESARYRELHDDKYYLPHDWPVSEQEALTKHCYRSFERYHATLKRLVDSGMDRKRAKESARYYLPYATQLQFDIMFNFRSFVAFQKLRNSPSAQLEIREIAEEMLTLVRADGRFQYSLEAWNL